MIKKPEKEKFLIGILAGLLLLVIAVPLPDGKKKEERKETQKNNPAETDEIAERLENILEKISGVGKAEVFITYGDRGKMIVEKDEVRSEETVREKDSAGGSRTTAASEQRRETVYGNGEQPYVVQQMMPKVEGVLVVAQGAGNASVKKQIMETIKALFGLETHKISIMKMEVSR